MHMFRGVTRTLAVAVIAALASCGTARAAIYASDLSVTGAGPYTLHYLLNEAAVSGSITVAASDAPDTPVATIPLAGDQLAKGAHDVEFDAENLPLGSYVFQVHVSAAPRSTYEIITPVTLLPTGAQVGYGARTNVYPGTAAYGHTFMSDFGTAKAIHEVNAAGELVQSIAMPATGSFVSVGVAVDVNGDVYGSDQNIDRIYRYAPTGSPAQLTWTQAEVYSGPIVDVENNYGSMVTRGFQLFGAGAEARVYMAGYSPVPNPVLTTVLGDTLSAPETLFDGTNIAGTRVDQILVSSDEKTIFITSGAAGTRHLNKWVYGVNPENQIEGWYLDPEFAENINEIAQMTGRSRGLAYTPDRQHLWVTQNLPSNPIEGNYVAKLSLSPSPASPLSAIRPLRIYGGIAEAGFEDFDLDFNFDGVIDMADILEAIRKPSLAGAVVDRVPAPSIGDPATMVLPVTMDADVKGNLIVVAHTDNTAGGTTGNAYYIVAPPDDGSSDTATSPVFQIEAVATD